MFNNRDGEGNARIARSNGEIDCIRSRRRCCGRELPACGFKDKPVEPIGCWITLAAAFGVNTVVAAIETSFALFYGPLVDKYAATKANVGISASLLISFGSISALVCSPFMNLYGCRPVAFLGATILTLGLILSAFAPNLICFHISFGVLGGTGNGLLYIPSMTIVQQKFTHNRGLATGLALLGFTAGTVLAPMLFDYLLNIYGLFGSLLLQAGAYAHSFVFVWAFKSPVRYRQSLTDKDRDNVVQNGSADSEMNATRRTSKSKWASFCQRLVDFSICRDVSYVLYVGVRLLWFFARFCLGTHIVSAATTLGIGLKQARYLPSIIGISNLVLRCFSTVMLNFNSINKEMYFSIGIICVTLACFLAATANGYPYLVAAMVMLGCNEGISTTAQQLVVVNLVGVDNFPKAMSVIEMATVPASLAAGPFSGWLVDVTNAYWVTFIVAGSAGVTACVLILIIIILLRAQKKKKDKHHKENSVVLSEAEELQHLQSKETDNAKDSDSVVL